MHGGRVSNVLVPPGTHIKLELNGQGKLIRCTRAAWMSSAHGRNCQLATGSFPPTCSVPARASLILFTFAVKVITPKSVAGRTVFFSRFAGLRHCFHSRDIFSLSELLCTKIPLATCNPSPRLGRVAEIWQPIGQSIGCPCLQHRHH